jgi:hypothetical protein
MARKQTQKEAQERSAKITKALELIAEGESVRKSCESAGIPVTTFLENVGGEQYARARDAQADRHFDEMADLERECLDGELDPQALRAVIDSRKWRLARMRPKAYGDRQEIDHTGEVRMNHEVALTPAVEELIKALSGATGPRSPHADGQ